MLIRIYETTLFRSQTSDTCILLGICKHYFFRLQFLLKTIRKILDNSQLLQKEYLTSRGKFFSIAPALVKDHRKETGNIGKKIKVPEKSIFEDPRLFWKLTKNVL